MESGPSIGEEQWVINNGLSWEEDGIVYIEGRIYITNNKKLKEKILQENHDSMDVGHPE